MLTNKRIFRFKNEMAIQASSQEEAEEIFSEQSDNFAADAECEELTPDMGIVSKIYFNPGSFTYQDLGYTPIVFQEGEWSFADCNYGLWEEIPEPHYQQWERTVRASINNGIDRGVFSTPEGHEIDWHVETKTEYEERNQ